MNKQTLLTLTGPATAVFLVVALLLAFATGSRAQQIALPPNTPDAAIGLTIYAERCAVCHGALGMGDGEQALTAGLSPTVFADPAYRLTADPQVMWETISLGRLENGMPPFGESSTNPLSEQDRWHLIAAIYSLSTPQSNLAEGETLFTAAAGDPTNIPVVEFWYTSTNMDARAALSEGEWDIDVADLTDEEKDQLVDYGRSAQSYIYSNPLAAFEPIPQAIITGRVVNGSISEPVTDAEVVLRAFTRNLEETITITQTVNAEGLYEFMLEDVPPDYIYLLTTEYDGLNFNSNANQLSQVTPRVDMPIIVYDNTTDPTAVFVEQLHMILSFVPDAVRVMELYVFSNDANSVFVGESGAIEEGTVQIALPAGATNVNFQRSFGSLDNFAPAREVIQTETGWADTLPLYPGSGSTSLLVSYDLPYEDGLQLAHPLPYNTLGATVILPDNGVTITDDAWINQGAQTSMGGSFNAYSLPDLTGQDALNMTLEGAPQEVVTDAQGGRVLVRDETAEILIGAVAFAAAIGVAFFLGRRWHTPATPTGHDAATLVRLIAELDEDYENGRISEHHYQHHRDQMKAELRSIWPGNLQAGD